MDQIAAQKILDYLANNTGRPTKVDEIAENIGIDSTSTNALLVDMLKNHLVYPWEGYWYISKEGSKVQSGEIDIKGVRKYYNDLRKYYADQEQTLYNRREMSNLKYKQWIKDFEAHVRQFKKNHPELAKMMETFSPDMTPEELAKYYERGPASFNAAEWRADTQSHFLKHDFSHPDMLYAGEQPGSYQPDPNTSTLEHAMAQSLQRFREMTPRMDSYFLNKDEYRELHDKASEIYAEITRDLSKFIEGNYTPGTVVGSKNIVQHINNIVQSKLQLEEEVLQNPVGGGTIRVNRKLPAITRAFYDKFTSVVENLTEIKGNKIFFDTQPVPEVISGLLKLVARKKNPTEILNTFKSTSSGKLLASSEVLSGVLSSNNWKGKNFDRFSFNGLTILGAYFEKASLKNTAWNGAVVTNCNFENADASNSNFEGISTFSNNNIQNMNFDKAAVPVTINLEDNIGRPSNYISRRIDIDKGMVKDISNIVPITQSISIPIKQEDMPGAVLLHRALRVLFNNSSIISASAKLKLAVRRNSTLVKIAELPPNTKELIDNSPFDKDVSLQILEFASDETKIPTFDYGDNLSQWAKEQAREGKLKWLGKWTGKFIGNATKISSGENVSQLQEKAVPQKDNDKSIVNTFVGKYLNSNTVDLFDIFNLLRSKKSIEGEDVAEPENTYLGHWLQSLSSEGKISLDELKKVYNSLDHTINEIHKAPGVNIGRHYEALPYVSKTFPISESTMGAHQVAGKGQQFSVVVSPNFEYMPSDLKTIYQAAQPYVGMHYPNHYGFARIAPMIINEIDSSKDVNIRKKVWFISEMQSDMYQKYGRAKSQKILPDVRRALKNQGRDQKELDSTVDDFRSMIRHWPFVLLNSIIEQASASDIDEIWMPQAKDVEEKTSVGSAGNWTPSYDVPAKAFGFTLQGIGKSITLDPGSGYSRTTNTVYVLDLNKLKEEKPPKATARLIKIAEVDPQLLEKYEKDFEHHLNWIIDNNRAKFEEVSNYITDEMLVQFAWGTFFDEYNVPAEHRNDNELMSELKKFLKEKYDYNIWSAPYIDWLGWFQRAIDDLNFFIKNQKEISPDLNVGDEELSRDWIKLWQEEVIPTEMISAPWYVDKFLVGIQRMLKDKGYGDIFGTTWSPSPGNSIEHLINPINTNTPGGLLLDPSGNPIDPKDLTQDEMRAIEQEQRMPQEFKNLSLDYTEAKAEMIDELLDKLNEAMRNNDEAKANSIRNQINELNSLASLKFRSS